MRLPSAEGSCVRAIRCYVLRLTPMGSCRTRLSLRGLGILFKKTFSAEGA
jgi:hypothetical protein